MRVGGEASSVLNGERYVHDPERSDAGAVLKPL
jgi:hypothetical protein